MSACAPHGNMVFLTFGKHHDIALVEVGTRDLSNDTVVGRQLSRVILFSASD